jgi:hypothetical protein
MCGEAAEASKRVYTMERKKIGKKKPYIKYICRILLESKSVIWTFSSSNKMVV